MDLVDHWVVGFSGNRQLNNPEAVRLALREVLQELRKLVDGQLVAMSCIAIGSDLLFAAEATNAGLPWICILPFPEEDFFNERDFPDASHRQAARQKLALAGDCEIMRIPRGANEPLDPTWRRTAFADGGFRCVDECDVFIAVFDETNQPAKPGGTAEVVAYARARKRPILIVDPGTVQIRQENWPPQWADELTESLRNLPAVPVKPEDRAKYPTPSALAVAEWRGSLAAVAEKHKFQTRWGNTTVIILNALAALITAFVFVLLHRQADQTHAQGWIDALDDVAFLSVLGALIVLIRAFRKRPHARHADFRLAAEIGRSLLAVWAIPGTAPRILHSPSKRFAHLVRNLLVHYRLDPDRLRDSAGAALSEDEVNTLARDYVKTRVQNQINHYSPRYKRAKRLATILVGSIFFFSSVAVVSAGVLAFKVTSHDLLWGMFKLAAAIATPVAVSMLAIHEAKRREARYHEMCEMLREYEPQIAAMRSLSSLQDLIVDVESMLLGENYEWWIMAKENLAA